MRLRIYIAAALLLLAAGFIWWTASAWLNLLSWHAVSADGTIAAAVQDGTKVRVWDAVTGERIVTLKHYYRVVAIRFVPELGGSSGLPGDNGERLAITTVRIWDYLPDFTTLYHTVWHLRWMHDHPGSSLRVES